MAKKLDKIFVLVDDCSNVQASYATLEEAKEDSREDWKVYEVTAIYDVANEVKLTKHPLSDEVDCD